MLQIVKKYIPYSMKQKVLNSHFFRLAHLVTNYFLDMKIYKKYSGTFDDKRSKENHEASLIFYYHKIEKGLSLPYPKVGFGRNNVNYLVSLLEDYNQKYGWNEVSKVALNCLYSYYNFNKSNGLDMNDLLLKIEGLQSTVPSEYTISVGGVRELSKSDIFKKYNSFRDFAYSRHSIRNFSNEEVSLDLIKEAVEIAQKTPSVCNRQTSRVYVYSDDKLKREVLKYQNGNTGFGEHASKILIVTTSTEGFIGGSERNQGYIDGGMYSMSLIYALHSLGVGTCPLNLALTHSFAKRLKQVANIDDSELLIMMIAVGHLPDKLKVASSHRRDSSEVMKVY